MYSAVWSPLTSSDVTLLATGTLNSSVGSLPVTDIKAYRFIFLYGLAALLVALPLLVFSFYKGLLKTRCAPVFAPVAGSLHAWLRVGTPVFTKVKIFKVIKPIKSD